MYNANGQLLATIFAKQINIHYNNISYREPSSAFHRDI